MKPRCSRGLHESAGRIVCGIAAIFSSKDPVSLETIKRMTAEVRHRGPDDEGYALFTATGVVPCAGADTRPETLASDFAYTPQALPAESLLRDAKIAMGHRRLSIVDLSAAGHQPMCTPDRRYWIVYNGEIYNHIELRAELEDLGCGFQSHCDTEVLLHAYAHWGVECLHRFNGMFAFVIVDRVARRVFAARDRFGVKPLYFWRSTEGLFAIASEIKQFTALPGWRPELNGEQAYNFLAWGLFDHTNETLFQGVRQLRGGEYFECEIGQLKNDPPVRRWYDLRPAAFAGDLPEASQQFRDLLTCSVRLRLRADVPVGSCLSGGLDSSSIVCIANGLLRKANAHDRQNTFSARAEAERYDETNYAREVIRATGVEAHFTLPALDGLFAAMPQITWHQDEPFGSTSIYAQWRVFELAAANNVKVMLDGQGADELLAGYHGFFGVRFASLLKRRKWMQLMRDVRATRLRHGPSTLPLTRYALNFLLPEWLRQPLRALVGRESTLNVPWLDVAALAVSERDPHAAAGATTSVLRDLSMAQLTHTSLPMLLHWEDRDSMAHSIESRVPFLDYRLVEFALGLPDDFKLCEGVTKRVLREAMTGILPEKIRLRVDKLGFATPEEVWMRERQPDVFRRAMEKAIEQSHGILLPGAMQVLEETIAGRRPFSFLCWRMISFGAWMERFGVQHTAGS